MKWRIWKDEKGWRLRKGEQQLTLNCSNHREALDTMWRIVEANRNPPLAA